ncbi:hypothetical protein JHK85_018609 [Glycine max]|nr:hypothetical protein JHK85_018609 [Glycine max]
MAQLLVANELAHLLDGCTSAGARVESTRQNLDASFVNAFEMVVLRDYIDKEDATIKIGAIMGLGIAYVLIDAFEDLNNEEENGIEECLSSLDGLKEIPPHKVNMKEMKVENKIEKVKNELSMLSPSLKCVSFKEDVEKQVVMSNSLSKVKKRRLKFLDLSRMRLHPQLAALINGFIRMWKSMLKCLQKQFGVIMETR